MTKHAEEQIACRLSDAGVRRAVLDHETYSAAFRATGDQVTCLRLNEITNFASWKSIRKLAKELS